MEPGALQFWWWQVAEEQSQYAHLLPATPLLVFLSTCYCLPAVNTLPPTHLMPGLAVVLVIKVGGLAGVLQGGAEGIFWGLALGVWGCLGWAGCCR